MVSTTCIAGPSSSLRPISRTLKTHPRRLFSTTSSTNDHYKTLGVPRTASKAQIKTHFYQLSKKHHPDVHAHVTDNQTTNNKEYFSRITEAYTILSNDRERRLYDRSLLSRPGPTHPAHRHHVHKHHTDPVTANNMYGFRPRPGSTAQHAWESPRRQSSPYTRSTDFESPRSGQQQSPRRPGSGAHYEPWKPPPERPRSQYVDLNEKALEHLERELEIQRISGSWRAIQILGVMSLTVILLGFR